MNQSELRHNKNDAGDVNPAEQTLGLVFRIRKCLKFSTRFENGESFVSVEDPVRSKNYRIGLTEYRFIAKVNGVRSNADVFELLQTEATHERGQLRPSEDLAQEQVVQIANWLLAMNLVTVNQADNALRLNAMAQQLERAKMMGWLNPISMKLSLFNPNRVLKSVQPLTEWLFSSWFFLLWLVTGGYSLTCLINNWDRIYASSSNVLSSGSWIWLLITWFVLKVIHESAHGIACRKYGGEVPEFGVLFILFAPLAYVSVTSMWRLANRWQRMVVSVAGMYVELLVAFLAIIVWSKTDGVLSSVAFSMMVMSSITTIVFNANPLMRFDGYFLLSDLLAIPNLYGKGGQWFAETAKQLFLGVPKQIQFQADERVPVAIYGVLAFLWRVLISLSLIIAASVLLQGAGLVLSGIGVVIWFALPIVKHFILLTWGNPSVRINRFRTAVSAACLIGMVAASVYVLRAPATKSAPAIVQLRNESIIRSDASGFVTAIHVAEGQTVCKGDLLLELANPELANELVELNRLREEAKIQSRIHQQSGNQAMVQAETQRVYRLTDQIIEKQSATESLQVVACNDGIVIERTLANRLGSFVDRGDELLTLAKLDGKEVVVSVDQSEYDATVWANGKQLRLMFPGKPVVNATLVSINPRASQVPTFPSLTAARGGALPVRALAKRPSGEDEFGYELLSPRFDVTVAMPKDFAQQVLAGQRGYAYFESTEQSLASYLYVAACHWLKSKIELAAL